MIKEFINKIFNHHPKNPISFKQGFELTELPVVTFYHKDKKFNFILDTGSNNNLINGSILKDIEHEKIDQYTNSYGVEGNKTVCQFCNITFSCNGTDYPYIWQISDLDKAFQAMKEETGVNVHGVIGSNFFNKFKYVLDFNELIAYSKQ